MNIGRFLLTVGGIWLVRVILNATFYTQIIREQYQQVTSAHPDMFREVVPAYIVGDLLFAIVFAFLLAKVGPALGGGVRAGVILGVIISILSPVLGNLYQYYSFTFLPLNLVALDSAFHVVAHAVQGVTGGLLLKTPHREAGGP